MTDPALIPHPRHSIRSLTERFLAGQMEAEEFEHFESILLNDPAARQVYIEHINVHAQLSYMGGAVAALEDGVYAPATSARSHFALAGLITTSVACCLILGFSIFMFVKRDGIERPGPVIGQFRTPFTPDSGTAGQTENADTELRQGVTYNLPAGVTRFQLSHGINGSVNGPGQMRFLNPSNLQLDSGVLIATVSPQAIGFRITTPHAELVDLGTTFSVSVDERSAMQVYEGKVSAQKRDPLKESSHPVVVQAGQSIFVSQASPLTLQDEFNCSRQELDELIRLAGIAGLNGAIEFLPVAPRSVESGKLVSDRHISLILERRTVELTEPLHVAPPRPEPYVAPGKYESIPLARGTQCSSFLLHCDFLNRREPLTGSIRFERPIIGLIFSSPDLQHSDTQFAIQGTAYPDNDAVFEKGQSRGCVIPYGGKGEISDTIQVHQDGRGLTVTLNAPEDNIDQIRILLHPPEH